MIVNVPTKQMGSACQYFNLMPLWLINEDYGKENKLSVCLGSCNGGFATTKFQNKTSVKHSWNSLESFLDIFLKHTWTFLKTSFNTFETPLKHPMNFFQISLYNYEATSKS